MGIVSHPSNVERHQNLALNLPGPFWVGQSDMLSRDIHFTGIFGFARCPYLGNVDLTLSGINITQGRVALKWLAAWLEVSAGCGM